MTTDKMATVVITVCAAMLAALTTAFAATGGFEAQPEWGAPRFEPAPSARPGQSVEGDGDDPRSPDVVPATDATSEEEPATPAGEAENDDEAKPESVGAPKGPASGVDTPDEPEDGAPKAGRPSNPAEPDEAESREAPEEPEDRDEPDEPAGD